MKIDPIPEAVMPDTTSPADASTLASARRALEELGVKNLEEIVAQDQTGRETRNRWRAKKLRDKSLAKEELPTKKKIMPQKQASFRPLWDGDQLRAKLQSYDRTPFLDLLAVWMECTPDVQTIMNFAAKHPDRFIHSMNLIGKMGGYTEKRELEVSLTAQVTALSDSQLEDRLRDAAYRLGIPLPKALNLKAIDVTPTPADKTE